MALRKIIEIQEIFVKSQKFSEKIFSDFLPTRILFSRRYGIIEGIGEVFPNLLSL